MLIAHILVYVHFETLIYVGGLCVYVRSCVIGLAIHISYLGLSLSVLYVHDDRAKCFSFMA